MIWGLNFLATQVGGAAIALQTSDHLNLGTSDCVKHAQTPGTRIPIGLSGDYSNYLAQIVNYIISHSVKFKYLFVT